MTKQMTAAELRTALMGTVEDYTRRIRTVNALIAVLDATSKAPRISMKRPKGAKRGSEAWHQHLKATWTPERRAQHSQIMRNAWKRGAYAQRGAR